MHTRTHTTLQDLLDNGVDGMSADTLSQVVDTLVSIWSNTADSDLLMQALDLAASSPSGTASPFPRPTKTNRKIGETAVMLGIPKSFALAFDILAGHTCPWADECQARVVVDDSGNRTIAKGKNMQFLCYAAKLEAVYTATYDLHKSNTDKVLAFTRTKDAQGLALHILAGMLQSQPQLATKGGIVRWHASGDFFNPVYRQAALLVMAALPNVVFFGYSKGVDAVAELNSASNCFFVHSHGSRQDAESEALGQPQCYVRTSPDALQDTPTACAYSTEPSDFLWIVAQQSFAINIH